MKLYLKLISLLCAALMLVSALAACALSGGDETQDSSQTTDPAGPAETEDPLYDKDGYLKSTLPEDLDYSGKTVTVLHWKDVERAEFEILESEQGLDIVKDQIYNRNAAVEARFGIKFEWIGQKGNNDNLASFVNYVQNSYNDGTYYDIIATYSRTAASLSADGLLQDLNTVENSYLDLEKPWWPKLMVDTCSMEDSLFFVSGDISTNLLHMMYAIYYNMDMLKNLKLEDPVEMVDNKTWTLDKLIEMCTGLYQDSDQSGGPSNDDIFGFTSNYFHLEAFYTGAGMKLLEPGDGKDVLKISDDYWSQKTVDLVDKLIKWFEMGDTYIYTNSNKVANDAVFYNGNALFTQNRVYIADNQYADGKLRSVDWEYGILPNPLYDKSQEDYVTLLGNPITLWSVMEGAKDTSMSTAVIECLASEAYRKTSPALFENNMKYRYTPDTLGKGDSARMFDIIRDNISFDLGRMFAQELDYISEKPLRAALEGTSWATKMKLYQVAYGKRLEILNKGLADALN